MANLFIGISVMLASLLMQALLFVVVIRYYTRIKLGVEQFSFAVSLMIVSGVLLLLVIGALIQIGLWALLFLMLGEFQLFTESYYHSAVNFSTLGYGDVVMSEKHKLLGPLEAVNGVIMIGLSTSALTVAFQDIIKSTINTKRA
jgi:hypothetical protein